MGHGTGLVVKDSNVSDGRENIKVFERLKILTSKYITNKH